MGLLGRKGGWLFAVVGFGSDGWMGVASGFCLCWGDNVRGSRQWIAGPTLGLRCGFDMVWDSDGSEVFGYLAYSNVTGLCSIFPIRASKLLYMTLAFFCLSHGCGTPSSIARPHAPRSLHRPRRLSAEMTCPVERPAGL